jgi:lipid II isoglutaminyl synthase (glutamine-hydrolysing)
MPGRYFAKPLPLPAQVRALLAIGLGRFLMFALRLVGRGATALPGKAALWVDPHLLARLTEGRQVFLVTGTNGKTTTVRILCTLLQAAGYRTITNPSGANLDSGLTATLLDNLAILRGAAPRGGIPAETRPEPRLEAQPEPRLAAGQPPLALVFEIDEAFFGKLAALLNPAVSVVTNFFRDQLDRFGELQHTRDLIARGLAASGGKAVLCADDSLCASLGRGREPADTFYFGLAAEAMLPRSADAIHEASYCTFCGSHYEYDGMSYGHLGRFACPGCGFNRPEPDLVFRQTGQQPQSQTVQYDWHGEQASATLTIPGLHNGYNSAAALLAVLAAGLPFQPAVAALSDARAAFGRMERFQVDDKDVCLILVKNPVGMDRALDFVAAAPDAGGIMLLLNSNDPDGRDVSWIWDVHFEAHLPPGILGVSGVRCHDMALRLYYAGKLPGELQTDPDHATLFDQLLQACPPGRCLYILPNYTALLALRADLARRYRLRDFWR